MSGAGLLLLVHQQRQQVERTGLELTRALATAVDAELHQSVAALEVLASSPALDRADVAAFRESARRAVAARPDWLTVILADPAGRVLINTTHPAGEAPPPIIERASFDRVLHSRAAVIGGLARGVRGEFAVPVRVPVVRDGTLLYVLSGVVKPQAIARVLSDQRVPGDWIASVFDAKLSRIGRSRAAQHLGGPPSPSLQRLISAGDHEGVGLTETLEGEPVYTAFTRTSRAGWVVALGIPTLAIDKAAYRSIAAYGGGLLLSLLLALLAAVAIARGINRPIGQLRQAAQALGNGETLRIIQPSVLREVQEVTDALVAAAAQLACAKAEREQLLRSERAARVEIERARFEAETARNHSDAANRTKDEFLAMLGHELRNPLAPIVTALHLMAMRGSNVHVNERHIIERQVAHLSRLVDDLLDVSRITRGKVQLQRERVDMKRVVGRAMEMVEPIFDQRTLAVEVHLPPEPVFVMGDTVRLAQVLINLLTNAAKFTPDDGRISLRLRTVDGAAEVSVEDTGSGISPELIAHVFDLFVQGKQSLDRHVGGLGLGLAIVKTLVEMHGGSVSASSEGEGMGSRFVVRVPLAGEQAPVVNQTPAQPAVRSQSRRILIVDDNLDAADTLSMVLAEVGHDVRVAVDGPSALEVLDTFMPELALLDIGLPGMDGYELARRLKDDPRTRAIRLVALTGYGSELDRARALGSGFSEHFVKPVIIERLLSAIDHMTGTPVA